MENAFTESNLSSLKIDRDFLIMEKTNYIAIERAMMEYDMYDRLESIYYEGMDFKKANEQKDQPQDPFSFDDEEETKKPAKEDKKKISMPKKGVLGKICMAIDNFVKSLMEMFHNIFGKGENISADEFLKSPGAKMQINAAAAEYQKMLQKKEAEANVITQKIANHVPVSDEVVDKFVNIGAGMYLKNEKKIVTSAEAYVINSNVMKSINKTRKTAAKMQKMAEKEAGNLSKKETEQMIKMANSLNSTLVNVGKEEKELMKELAKHKK